MPTGTPYRDKRFVTKRIGDLVFRKREKTPMHKMSRNHDFLRSLENYPEPGSTPKASQADTLSPLPKKSAACFRAHAGQTRHRNPPPSSSCRDKRQATGVARFAAWSERLSSSIFQVNNNHAGRQHLAMRHRYSLNKRCDFFILRNVTHYRANSQKVTNRDFSSRAALLFVRQT